MYDTMYYSPHDNVSYSCLQEYLLRQLMHPRATDGDLQVSTGLASFMNFGQRQQELQNLRKVTMSDNTQIRSKDRRSVKRAVTFGGIREGLEESSIDSEHDMDEFIAKKKEDLPSIKIQIDEEPPKSRTNSPVNRMGVPKTQRKVSHEKSPQRDFSSPSNIAFSPRKSKLRESMKANAGSDFVELAATEEKETKHGKNGKPDPVMRAMKLERLNKLEKYIRKNAIKVSFRDELNKVENSTFVDDKAARRVATFLFWNIKHDIDAHDIVKEDLKPFLSSKEDIDLAFAMMDGNKDGKVSMKECIAAVENIYHERCNLATTLRDAKNITRVLETLLGIIIHFFFVFLYLFVFQLNVGQIWLAFSGKVMHAV